MAALLSSTRSVHAQSVQPVILDLQTAGRQSTQTLTVNNTRASAIPSSYASKDLYLTPTAPGGRARIPVILLFFLPRQSYSRSEAHTSELQSLMRTPYAVSCSEKKKNQT